MPSFPETLPTPILYVTPDSGPSGANFSLLRLVQNLDRDRFTPYVVCPQPLTDLLKEEMDALNVPLTAVYMEEWGQMVGEKPGLRRLIALPKRMLLRARTVIKLANQIRQRGIRVVHTNSVLVMEGALAAKLAHVPHVWHIRDRIGPEGSVQYRAGLDKAIQRIQSLSAKVITISNYVREPFDLRCPPGLLETIYNSVDLDAYLSAEQQPDTIRAEFGLSPSDPLIATVGHVTPEKRQEDFIRAAARIRLRFPRARFLIVGKILDFHQAYYRSLQALVASLELEDAVIFTGLRRDIPAILASIDLMIHPRTNEGFGRVIIEAMAAGKPVVSVHSGGPAEIIEDGVTGRLVSPKNPEELADASLEILSQAGRAREMGKKGRDQVARRFTDAAYVHHIESVYQEILDTPSQSTEGDSHAHG